MVQGERFNKSSIDRVVFEYNVFDWVFGVVPYSVTLSEERRNIYEFIAVELSFLEDVYCRDAIHPERFQFAVGIIADEIPAVLRLFQKVRQELFVYDFPVMAYQGVVKFNGISFSYCLQ